MVATPLPTFASECATVFDWYFQDWEMTFRMEAQATAA
jgi:hypothetical protein